MDYLKQGKDMHQFQGQCNRIILVNYTILFQFDRKISSIDAEKFTHDMMQTFYLFFDVLFICKHQPIVQLKHCTEK